jgi:peptidoglycan/xylan/chitin deacetylase (PgdA/CDA1 family)
MNITLEGACSPPNSITDVNTMSIPFSVARNLMLVNYLLLVHLVRSIPDHFPIASHQYPLTNLTHCRVDHQMAHIRPIRGHPTTMARCPQRRRFVRRHPRHPHFYLDGWRSNLRRARPQRTGNMLWHLSVQRRERNLGAPDGMIGLSVDDGPVGDPDASPRLYDFLKEQNQKISHFMIGANIRDNPQVFLRAFQELEDDIGVHTWSHPYMTTLTNEQVVAEIGWTLQIIHDSTGGRVPRYWRPPYGDADNRVRAIAFKVFGLTSVIWNRDTADWGLASNATTLEKIQDQFKEWLEGPRSPGLIVLEHEIEGADVTAFINALSLIR